MKVATVIIVAIVAVLATVAPTGAATEPLVIRLATLAPEGSPWHDALRDLAETWKEISKGDVHMKIFAGKLDEPSAVQNMRAGRLHAAGLSGAGLHKIIWEIQALQMPMMFRSDQELACVRERIGPKLERMLEDNGFKVLTWADAGWVYFFSKSRLVQPEDFKGKRIFVWGGETSIVEAWHDFGAVPKGMLATEIYQGLDSGLIEVVPTVPLAALAYQWFPLTPHMADVKWAPLVGALVITNEAWEEIPEELRPALLAAAKNTGKKLRAGLPGFERKAIEVMTEHGVVVDKVPVDIVADWERQARAAYEGILDMLVPRAMVDEVERLRDGCRG